MYTDWGEPPKIWDKVVLYLLHKHLAGQRAHFRKLAHCIFIKMFELKLFCFQRLHSLGQFWSRLVIHSFNLY